MNFFDKCKVLMDKTKSFKDLKEDFDNLNKWDDLVKNYFYTPKEEIINFIIKVRINNLVYTMMQRVSEVIKNNENHPYRTLYDLNPLELFSVLKGEYFTIVSKGAYDCIKYLKNINEDDISLACQIANFDDSIFNGLI